LLLILFFILIFILILIRLVGSASECPKLGIKEERKIKGKIKIMKMIKRKIKIMIRTSEEVVSRAQLVRSTVATEPSPHDRSLEARRYCFPKIGERSKSVPF